MNQKEKELQGELPYERFLRFGAENLTEAEAGSPLLSERERRKRVRWSLQERCWNLPDIRRRGFWDFMR